MNIIIQKPWNKKGMFHWAEMGDFLTKLLLDFKSIGLCMFSDYRSKKRIRSILKKIPRRSRVRLYTTLISVSFIQQNID